MSAIRALDETRVWFWRSRKKDEYLQLTYLFPWQEYPAGSQGIPSEAGVWDKE